MLSHVFAGSRSGEQGGSSDYVPNGQPTFRPVTNNNQTNQRYQRYGLAGLTQAGSVQTLNNVVNRCNSPGNRTETESMTNQNHWYQPPQPTFNFASPSNSREMRNKAEKQRRDRLNAFIGELATLVPLVAKSAKRLDKTSILRLTATHLRIYQTLVKGKGVPQMALPPFVDQFVVDQLICDEMGGFLLITSVAGKIIFVSHTVETLLGHLQTDLMGQSLFTVTASEDHDRLRMYLGSEGEMEQGWRKYFNIRIRRAGPKSESPQYESVRMMGVHRQLPSPEASASSSSSTGGASPMSSSASTSSSLQINTDILVFFVKLCRPQPLVDRLVAASKDEYVTRHLIDGRIIGCDQRISLIAGYMIEEIQGHSAFQYMHREDVRFVMIALRQMYDRGESRGNSCYRLKSSNGQFIYLKTFGFLEIDNQGIVESFICVNVQVDEKEGKHHINEMKRRYSAMFTSSLASLPYNQHAMKTNGDSSHTATITSASWSSSPVPVIPLNRTDHTEDPQTLEMAVNELMQNLPSPGSEERAAEVQSPPAPLCIGKAKLESSTSKPLHLRIKPSGKRAPSVSPDHVKRQRLTSVDSEPPQLSPPMDTSALPYAKGPPMSKMPKLEEQYPTTASQDVTRHHRHHHVA